MKLPVCFILLLVSPLLAHPKTARIIGGQPANAGAFPYAAAIRITTADGQYFCVGSILNHLWVLTAGQCVDGAISFTITVGSNQLSATGPNVQNLATDHYVLHPLYNPDTLVNDIGLIKFRMPLVFSTYVNSLYLPFADIPTSAVGTAIGWGQTSDADSALSDSLNFVQLSGVSDDECRLTYGGQLAPNMMCFEGSYNQGACFGDTGSPIIQHMGRVTIVVAVSTFLSGNGCESTDPSGYTKIFPYNEWINNVTATL